jgi:hypothetical protein
MWLITACFRHYRLRVGKDEALLARMMNVFIEIGLPDRPLSTITAFRGGPMSDLTLHLLNVSLLDICVRANR